MDEFQVRLVIDITADSPEDAVETFIEALVERGLRDWKYKVTTSDGESMLIWGNTLEQVTQQELLGDIQANLDAREQAVDMPAVDVVHEVEQPVEPVDDEAKAYEIAEQLAREELGAVPEE